MGILHSLAKKTRKNTLNISPDIIYRWSPKSMSGENISINELLPLFEAARWAPSSSNNQEWLFYLATSKDKSFSGMYELLFEGNQAWCKNAGALIVLVSKQFADYKHRPISSHSLDAGMALQNFAIQASKRDIVVRAMGGFDKDAARELLSIDPEHKVECMVAVGKQGSTDDLLGDKVSQRNPVEDIIIHLKD